MASRSLIATALAVALLALLAVPAAATSTGPRGQQPPSADELLQRLPAGTIAVDRHGIAGTRTPTDAVRGVTDHRNRAAWLGSIADVIEARSGDSVAVSGASTSSPDEPVGGSYARGVAAGDLDRDGLDDVVVFRSTPDGSTLEARRGFDGNVLWQQATGADGGLAWPLGRDVTGDGIADLLTYDLEVLDERYGDCDDDDECIANEYEVTFRWVVGVTSGIDGNTLWSRTFDGHLRERLDESYDETLAVSEYKGVYRVVGTNVDVFPFLADLEGDGKEELLLESIDVDVTQTYNDMWAGALFAEAGQADGTSKLRAVTRVDVVEVLTGDVGRQLSETAEGMVAVLYPVGAVGGDDLVWERSVAKDSTFRCTYVWTLESVDVCDDEPEGVSLEVQLLDGATFAPAWKADFDQPGYVEVLADDVDNDGRNDVVVSTETDDWDMSSDVVSSQSGKVLWQAGNGFVVASGPYDDQAGADLIVASFVVEEGDLVKGDSTETMTLARHNGATGKVLASTQRTMSSSSGDSDFTFGMLYIATGGDFDADGATDLTHGEVRYSGTCVEDEDDSFCEVTEMSSDGVAESARTARLLLSANATDQSMLLYDTGDLDGDGRTEVARDSVSWTSDASVWTFAPLRVADATALWTDTVQDSYMDYGVAGNIDGGHGDDLVRNAEGAGTVEPVEGGEGTSPDGGGSSEDSGQSGDWGAFTAAVDGATGQRLWTAE